MKMWETREKPSEPPMYILLKTLFLVAKVTSGLKTSLGTDSLGNLAMLGLFRALILLWALQRSAGWVLHFISPTAVTQSHARGYSTDTVLP